jgi:hypothetical protein
MRCWWQRLLDSCSGCRCCLSVAVLDPLGYCSVDALFVCCESLLARF